MLLVLALDPWVRDKIVTAVSLTITTVAYAARPDFVLRESGIFAGRVKASLVPPERALDIDTPLDFEFAEFLLNRRSS